VPVRSERAIVVAFHAAAVAVAAVWLFVLPYDVTDLSYLLSLEDHAWVTQEVVHPLWVPLLWVYRAALRGVGFRGFVLVPIEIANVLVSLATALLVFRVGRRATRDPLAAAIAALLLMSTNGFGSAAVRPTPYALGFACVLGSLLLLAGERRASPLRTFAAGAIGGLAMSLHASAMALALAALLCSLMDPERRSWRDAILRAASFALGMLVVFSASWAAWFAFNGLDRSFFELARLRALFGGVEQVPGTSIYSSHSPWGQVVGLCRTLVNQGSLLVPAGALAAFVEVRRLRDPDTSPGERRLTVATLACFASVGAFFLINNNRNGFNYAGLALVPLLVARAASRASRARPALGAIGVVAVALAANTALAAGRNRFHDPLPQEVAFVESALGPRGVLLVPGCAFSELRLISSLAVFRVRTPGDQGTSCSLPSAETGDALRARVRGWREQGRRVLFACGDEEHDFSGDANGMEKDVQLFWSPELSARQRAPKLRAAREALATAGLRLEDGIVSPRGGRYRDVIVDAAGERLAPPRVLLAPTPVNPTDAWARVVAREVERFHALVADDAWAPCDAICARLTVPEDGGSSSADVPSACGCPGATRRGESSAGAEASQHGEPACWFARPASSDELRAYIGRWTERAGLDAPVDWGASLDRAHAEVTIQLRAGRLRVAWRLLPSCEAASVEVDADGAPVTALATPEAARDFAAHFPAPKARSSESN
jgi:hypothetical protein